MNDMTRAQKAKELFENGYNCSQAVAMAFSDKMGMDELAAAKLASGLGGGVGRLREVCGAVSGMTLAAGALYGFDAPDNPESREKKANLYALVQKMAGEFKEANGSLICRELLAGINNDTNPLPEARTAAYYQKRPCAELVYCAAKILEDEMNAREEAK